MNANDILKYGQQTVMEAIDAFPESAWETPGACGVWSVKDILAHLASYEEVLVDILTTFTADSPTPALNTFIELGAQFNDIEVNKRREQTVQDVLAEFNDTHTQVMLLISKIPDASLRQTGTLPWYGVDYSLDDVIVYMYYGHKREHSAQIAAFRDHLKR
jgi:uncharacterized damage-inducible protein DinB